MAIECAGVMPTCTNKFPPCGHNFGGCLARIAIKGAVDIFSYTRFQRTGPRWFPTSSAGAAEPTGPSVPSARQGPGRSGLGTHSGQRRGPERPHAQPTPRSYQHRISVLLPCWHVSEPSASWSKLCWPERARKNKTSKWLIKRIKQPHGAATTTHHWMGARS